MNGAHDLGGMHGMGPIDIDPDQPLFHDNWEKDVFSLVLGSGFLGQWNIDKSRFFREKMPGPDYLNTTYYEHWLFGLEALLDDAGLVSKQEINDRLENPTSAASPVTPALTAITPNQVVALLEKGGPANLNATCAQRFKIGDRVQVINRHPTHHTRAPRYTRGHIGTIFIEHGGFIFADTHAMTMEKKAAFLYNVKFDAHELWGSNVANDPVYVDLFDCYLDPAS